MKLTSIQGIKFVLSVCCMLSCGCAAPFRPAGWVCYKMEYSVSDSLEYCSAIAPATTVVDGDARNRNCSDSWPNDPFLATYGDK